MRMNCNLSTENLKMLEEMEFNLSDFALFLSVMKNKSAHQNVLSIITGNSELHLKYVHVEEVILNRSGRRAIRLDAQAVDDKNCYYATEMQNDTSGDDIRRRSRFYQGLLDTPLLKSGKKTRYKELPATVVTFITQEDIFGEDLAKYTFTEQCEEIPGLHLEDGTTKLFLNMTSKKGDPVLVSLLQYMKRTRLDNPEITVKDPRILKLDQVVSEVKESEEWEGVKMSILSVGIEKGNAEGMRKSKKEDILSFLSDIGPISETLEKRIRSETDLETLGVWLKKAARASTVEEFEQEIA